MMSVICAMGFESVTLWAICTYIVRSTWFRGQGSELSRSESAQEEPPRWVGERAAPTSAPAYDGAGSPADTRPAPGRADPARRRPRLRGPLRALPPAHPRLRARDGQGPRPRGGRDAGGLRLRAAPHARDRAAARLQALALPDRQEQLHRRVPPLQARRGGLLRRRRRASRPADHSELVGSGPSPDAAVAAKHELDSLCGAFGGLSETHHEILVLRELEGLSYRGDRPPDGHEPPGRRVDAVPRAPAPDRGVRRHRLRRPLPAHPGHHRRRRRGAARRARHAPARPPSLALPAVPARGAGRRARPRACSRARACASAWRTRSPASCRSRSSRSCAAADAEAAAPPPAAAAPRCMPHLPMLSDQLSSGWGKAAAGAAVLVAGVGAGVGVQQATAAVDAAAGHAQSAPQSVTASASKAAAPAATAASDERRSWRASGLRAAARTRANPPRARPASRRPRPRAVACRAPRRGPRRRQGACLRRRDHRSGRRGRLGFEPARRGRLQAGRHGEAATSSRAPAKKQTPVKDAAQNTAGSVGTTVTDTTGAVQQTTVGGDGGHATRPRRPSPRRSTRSSRAPLAAVRWPRPSTR